MDQVVSGQYSLQRIIDEDLLFSIPRYQRLYVWEDQQVHSLFNDILAAAEAKKNFYYLGGLIIVENDKQPNLFDLVDGQQRLTTLWLLANQLGSGLEDFKFSSDQLRLSFAIREQVGRYFKELSFSRESMKKDADFGDLVRIDLARKRLDSLIKEHLTTLDAKKKFAEYLRNQVVMVITQVPPATDLNKLFETLNNRGVQLEQHELLKARLIERLPKKEQLRYSILWSVCSDMSNYFERALAQELGSVQKAAESFPRGGWQHNLGLLRSNLVSSKNDLRREGMSLSVILRSSKFKEKPEGNDIGEERFLHPDATDDELQTVRSILTFPQLLLHTLRIYLRQKKNEDLPRINEKELLHLFEIHFFNDHPTNDGSKVTMGFLNLLLQVREIFDKYIIKWVKEEEQIEAHLIKYVQKDNQSYRGRTFYLRRIIPSERDVLSGLALLQSTLYHSQQNTTQYWLTPFLYRLLEHPSFDEAYNSLKRLDNVLFSTNQETRLLTERTWECMETYPDLKPDTDILREERGTGFPHYWFYKMDFVLWHERRAIAGSRWDRYRMTAKNSVEHVSPQNPPDGRDKVCKIYENRFGNLVLVTRSINSEYGAKSFGEKKAKFVNKKEKGSFDSLKSDLIYSHEVWSDAAAEEHEKTMIELLESYFQKTMQHG